MRLSNTVLLAALPPVLGLPLSLESRQLNLEQLLALTTPICNAAKTVALDLQCPELEHSAIIAQVLRALEDICGALPPANLPVACAEVASLTASIAAVAEASVNMLGAGGLEGMYARGGAQAMARVSVGTLGGNGSERRGFITGTPMFGLGGLGSGLPGFDTLWPIVEPMVASVLGLAGTPPIPELTQPLGGLGLGLNGILAKENEEG